MERATSTLRRSGAIFLTLGTNNQELRLIISELHSLKSQVKVMRDSQERILKDIIGWTSVEENRPMQELFLHLSDLNSLWSEVQTQFADQIMEFRHNFEMILEGESNLDNARHKFAECEEAEQKAVKKLKKVQKKKAEEIRAAETKIEECKVQKQIAQNEVSEKVKENEAVKLIRIKDGLLKLTEAFLTLSHKCIYIFEAQKDIVKSLPDIEDKEIHEIRFDGLSGAKNAIQRAQIRVRDYNISQQSTQQRNDDPPPPPYSQNPEFLNTPYNPYYVRPDLTPDGGQPRNDASLYPDISTAN